MNTIGSLQALLISQDSSVSIVTWLQDGWLRKCLILCRDNRLLFSPKHPDWPGTHPAYSMGTGGSVPGHCPSWHAHRQSFFFYLLPALSFAMSSSTWLNCTVLSHSTHAIPLSFNSKSSISVFSPLFLHGQNTEAVYLLTHKLWIPPFQKFPSVLVRFRLIR